MSSPEGKAEPVNVRILDREYTVGVSDAERASLTSAARLLDLRMREVRGSNKMVATERVAVLAALNMAHELQQLRDENSARERELTRTLAELHRKLDSALEPPR